jgi:hypothetical protein
MNHESSTCAFLLTALYFNYLVIAIAYYLFLHFLSTNHKYTQPCYSNLPLRRRRWIEILRWGVLGSALPQVPFLWCYGVFRSFVSQESHFSLLRHYLCNKYTLFMTFGYLLTLLVCMCWTIDPGSYIRWVFGFGIKIGYGKKWYQSHVSRRNASLVRRVLSLALF